jgi:glucose-1-phosphate thymidylyltransferase
MSRKGLLLAGGTGTRLYPATRAVSKQLLPIYDKPMVFHPLCTLMAAGLRDIAIVTTPRDAPAFHHLLGDGQALGIALSWVEQPAPNGLPEAFLLAERFLDGSCAALILGDNLFHGGDLGARMAAVPGEGATIWITEVAEPSRFGVVDFVDGRPRRLVEKPPDPPSPWVLTGLYHVDGTAPERARSLRPSARGELEITDLLQSWLDEDALHAERLGPGTTWLDTGTHDRLLEAGTFVRTLQRRTGHHIASPEATAHRQGWIDDDALLRAAHPHGDSPYGRWLRDQVTRPHGDPTAGTAPSRGSGTR